MSYLQAKQCFLDIHNYISNTSDPVNFDIANGLDSLANAVEADMTQIKLLLGQILSELKKRS